MSDVFLRIRLEALELNLREVTALATAVGARSGSIRQLQALLVSPGARVGVELRRAQMAIDNIDALQKFPDFSDLLREYDLVHSLETARASLTALEGELAKVREHMQRVLVNVKETDALLSRDHVKGLFSDDSVTRLISSSTRLRLELKRNAGTTGAEASPQAWESFRVLLGDQEQFDLFQQYVDVAAGLSLRGMGMDEHFCAMADWLADYWAPAMVNLPIMFAIPARREATAIPSIIRLGFPEWTIWALPLFAHEFGRMLVLFDEDLQDVPGELAATLREDATKEPVDAEAPEATLEARVARIGTYMADVFATYVMGPAYACACLLLKLDPTAVGHGQQKEGWDLVRAHVVLETLERLSPGVQANVAETVTTLRESWTAAVNHLAPQPADGGRAFVRELVTRVVNLLELVEERNQTRIKFDDDAFETSRQWAEEYFADLPHPGEPQPVSGDRRPAEDAAGATSVPSAERDLTGVTLTQVLNAAWYRRLQQPESAKAIATCVREHIWPRLTPPAGPLDSSGHPPLSSDIRP
jgi:uncharacterized protein YbdZ (MbtH family)